ncbi:MAG: hypothetical protein ACRCU6_02995 [Fusobacteriaceae bacterium]
MKYMEPNFFKSVVVDGEIYFHSDEVLRFLRELRGDNNLVKNPVLKLITLRDKASEMGFSKVSYLTLLSLEKYLKDCDVLVYDEDKYIDNSQLDTLVYLFLYPQAK